MSKGSARRPTLVTQDEFSKRWDETFGQKEPAEDSWPLVVAYMREKYPQAFEKQKNL